MNKRYISVRRTARYFSLGELSSKTKKVYIILHGYAQNADDFLTSFNSLSSEDTFILAPEGLSHFYWKDLSSAPVSSWMTSLERKHEIEDAIFYLQEVYEQVFYSTNLIDIQVTYLGFSQGGAMLTRWLDNKRVKMDRLILYASALAHDIDYSKETVFLNKLDVHFIYGNQDRFVTNNKLSEIKKLMQRVGVEMNIYVFVGKHNIEEEAISYIKSLN